MRWYNICSAFWCVVMRYEEAFVSISCGTFNRHHAIRAAHKMKWVCMWNAPMWKEITLAYVKGVCSNVGAWKIANFTLVNGTLYRMIESTWHSLLSRKSPFFLGFSRNKYVQPLKAQVNRKKMHTMYYIRLEHRKKIR